MSTVLRMRKKRHTVWAAGDAERGGLEIEVGHHQLSVRGEGLQSLELNRVEGSEEERARPLLEADSHLRGLARDHADEQGGAVAEHGRAQGPVPCEVEVAAPGPRAEATAAKRAEIEKARAARDAEKAAKEKAAEAEAKKKAAVQQRNHERAKIAVLRNTARQNPKRQERNKTNTQFKTATHRVWIAIPCENLYPFTRIGLRRGCIFNRHNPPTLQYRDWDKGLSLHSKPPLKLS